MPQTLAAIDTGQKKKQQMRIQQILQPMVLFILCALSIGCSTTSFIQEVPAHVKRGKLYLAPKTIQVGDRQFNAEQGFIVVNENPSDTLSPREHAPVVEKKYCGRSMTFGAKQKSIRWWRQQARRCLSRHEPNSAEQITSHNQRSNPQ